ncbi:MAG: hypothetical protein NTX25_09015 [Proteobacteria bacterium]|nr:hypothetical protein [Pseudomonadota bacterium]
MNTLPKSFTLWLCLLFSLIACNNYQQPAAPQAEPDRVQDSDVLRSEPVVSNALEPVLNPSEQLPPAESPILVKQAEEAKPAEKEIPAPAPAPTPAPTPTPPPVKPAPSPTALSGFQGTTMQSVSCPNGRLIGLKYWAGWILDSMTAICSNSTPTAVLGRSDAKPNLSLSCAGSNNFVESVEIQAFSYDNSIQAVKINCTDKTTKTGSGSFPDEPQGVWQAAIKCPAGQYSMGIIGKNTNFTQSLGLICDGF